MSFLMKQFCHSKSKNHNLRNPLLVLLSRCHQILFVHPLHLVLLPLLQQLKLHVVPLQHMHLMCCHFIYLPHPLILHVQQLQGPHLNCSLLRITSQIFFHPQDSTEEITPYLAISPGPLAYLLLPTTFKPVPPPTHGMITQSKANIYKPKIPTNGNIKYPLPHALSTSLIALDIELTCFSSTVKKAGVIPCLKNLMY